VISYHAGRWRRGRAEPWHYEAEEDQPVADKDWSPRAQQIGWLVAGVGVILIILALIGWGYSSMREGYQTKRARAEACRSSEGTPAEIAVCIRAAGG
jgi:hypothetical protein